VELIASRIGDAFFGYFLSLGQEVTPGYAGETAHAHQAPHTAPCRKAKHPTRYPPSQTYGTVPPSGGTRRTQRPTAIVTTNPPSPFRIAPPNVSYIYAVPVTPAGPRESHP